MKFFHQFLFKRCPKRALKEATHPKRSLSSVFIVSLGIYASIAGCGVEQDQACAQYLECVNHYNEVFDRDSTVLEDYEEGGECWNSSQNAELCRSHCIEATSELSQALELANEDTGPCR